MIVIEVQEVSDMTKKVLICGLVVTFVLFGYIILIHSLTVFLSVEPKDIIIYITPITSLIGVGIATYTALNVMKRNHEDGNAKERNKQEMSDNIQFRKAVERIQEAVLITESHYEAMKKVDINKVYDSTVPIIIKQIEEIEKNMKDNKNLPFYDDLKNSKIVAVSSKILEKTFTINLFLTSSNEIMIYQRESVVKRNLKEISEIGEKFLNKEEFKFIKFEDLIN